MPHINCDSAGLSKSPGLDHPTKHPILMRHAPAERFVKGLRCAHRKMSGCAVILQEMAGLAQRTAPAVFRALTDLFDAALPMEDDD